MFLQLHQSFAKKASRKLEFLLTSYAQSHLVQGPRLRNPLRLQEDVVGVVAMWVESVHIPDIAGAWQGLAVG
jgi:hypothetical protein